MSVEMSRTKFGGIFAVRALPDARGFNRISIVVFPGRGTILVSLFGHHARIAW